MICQNRDIELLIFTRLSSAGTSPYATLGGHNKVETKFKLLILPPVALQ